MCCDKYSEVTVYDVEDHSVVLQLTRNDEESKRKLLYIQPIGSMQECESLQRDTRKKKDIHTLWPQGKRGTTTTYYKCGHRTITWHDPLTYKAGGFRWGESVKTIISFPGKNEYGDERFFLVHPLVTLQSYPSASYNVEEKKDDKDNDMMNDIADENDDPNQTNDNSDNDIDQQMVNNNAQQPMMTQLSQLQLNDNFTPREMTGVSIHLPSPMGMLPTPYPHAQPGQPRNPPNPTNNNNNTISFDFN